MKDLLFLILPISTIGSLFLKDHNKTRFTILTILLLGNMIFYSYPLIHSLLMSGGDVINQQSGTILWLYIFIFPSAALIQTLLVILKIVYFKKSLNSSGNSQ